MSVFDLVWVDAFTTQPLAGNACAVVLDATGLDDRMMQAVAREMNISETAFVFAGDDEADFNVRFFTPTSEIPLAGHPTIATTHALYEKGLLGPFSDVVNLRMPAGIVPVTIEGGATPMYAMSQPEPEFLAAYDRARIAAALSLSESDILLGCMPQTVSTGTPQLMVPLASLDALNRCKPVAEALFGIGRDWYSVHAFCQVVGDVNLLARHFADFGEDPFTGSATGGMAAYCARYGVVKERMYTVGQGVHLGRPGRAQVEIGGTPPHDIGRISVAGNAVTLMVAKMTLPLPSSA